MLASSASVNSHCASASASTRFGDLGLVRVAGWVAGKWLVLEGGGAGVPGGFGVGGVVGTDVAAAVTGDKELAHVPFLVSSRMLCCGFLLGFAGVRLGGQFASCVYRV